jgi:hypothetical protein
MEELNAPIYSQAKIEYTNQLVDILYPHLYDGIKSIYDETKSISLKKKNIPRFVLFRELLEKIPIWNTEILDQESNRIIHNSNCEWIDDLITAVFISHTKILTSIGNSNSLNKINVTIPKINSFIHKIYINVARELWKNPYLLNENIPGYEYQKNSKEIENIIKQCIENTIRKLLPIKEILKEHLEKYETNNPINKDEIKSVIQEELRELKEKLKIKEDEDSFDYQVLDSEESDKKEIIPENFNNKIDHQFKIELESEPNGLEVSENEENIENILSPKNDPSEETIKENCENIIVNDITIPVIEEKYDNLDLNVSNDKNDENKFEKMITIMDSDNSDDKPAESSLFKADNKPAEDKPAELSLFKTNDKSAEDKPAELSLFKSEDKPDDKPADDKPSELSLFKVDDKPAESSIFKVDDKPAELSLFKVDDKPAEPSLFKVDDKPPEDKPAENKPAESSIFKSEDKPAESSIFKSEDKSAESSIFKVDDKPSENKQAESSIFKVEEKIEVKKLDHTGDNTDEKKEINVSKEDIDDSASLANFFDDIQNIVDEKKINLKEDNNTFLFPDANINDISLR